MWHRLSRGPLGELPPCCNVSESIHAPGQSTIPTMQGTDYVRSIEEWRGSLEAELKREDSPIAMVGLFWLKEGVNTVGSSPDCTFCLPKGAPRLIGAFECAGRQLKFRVDIGLTAMVDGRVTDSGSSVKLRVDAPPSKITLNEITMIPVQFDGRLAIQAWDRARTGTVTSAIRKWFDVQDRFMVRGTYTPYPAPTKLSMPDGLGGNLIGYAQGYVSFKLDGKSHSLDATETDDGRLFLQFRDLTNGSQTFAEGRFLHSDIVSEDGGVVLDFNRAFNPPSAFTSLMPSPVAPRNHMLNTAVAAGERSPETRTD
jgi:uncharacterized protein (DUF1684 family)